MVREKEIEAKLTREIRKMGGITLKFVSPGSDGVPDRIVILPGGQIWFAEVKTEDGVVSAIQNHWIHNLRAHGCRAGVIRGYSGLEQFLERIKAELSAG